MLNSGDWTGDVFNMPIYVPYSDVPYLSNNASFEDIDINAGTIASGTLNLNVIGTNTSNLRYVFPGGFTIASGASVSVAPNVSVLMPGAQTFTDNGTLDFASGDVVTISTYGYNNQISVSGSLTANGTIFGGGGGGATIQVNYGGTLLANNATIFNLSNLTLNSGSSDSMNIVEFFGQLSIDSGATIDVSGDNFSNVGNQGIVATGDPSATINLAYNYWGTTVPAQIEAKILDHSTDPTRPTVNFQPYVSYTSGTTANPVGTTYSPSDQTLTFHANVTDSAGIVVNEGTETFTILNGTQIIGQTTTPEQVVNGTVSATYTLPGGTRPGQYIIEANYSGSGSNYLPSADTSHFLTINAAGATQLFIQTLLSSPATAGVAFAPQPVVYEEDQYGDLETGDNTTVVSVSLASGSGLLGTLNATVVGGVATFTNLSDNTANSITLNFTSGHLVPAISSNIVVDASSATKVAFGQGPSNATAGTAINPAVTVNVEDAFGNVVTTDNSSVTLTLSTGVFEGGSNTAAATAVNGVATFPNLKIDVAGNYTLAATDGTLSASGSSNGFTIGPAAASKILFGQQPTNTAAGIAISPPVKVFVADVFGNVATGKSSTVTLTLNTGTFEGGLNTATASAVNGVATFPNLKIDSLGNYTLSATDGTLTPTGASNNFTITPAPASKVVFGQQPTNTTAGVAISPAVTVLVEDAVGNLITTNNSTVTLTLSRGTFAGGAITATVMAVNGVATFPGLIINTSGNYTLSATDGTLTGSGPSSSFTISAAMATKVVFGQQPTNAAPRAAISPPVTVQVEDMFGNVVTGDSSTVTLTLNIGTLWKRGLEHHCATATAVNGVATFSDLKIDVFGIYTLSATDGALMPSGPSNVFAIDDTGQPSRLAFGQQPTNATADVVISPAVTVDVEDAFGNVVTGDHSLVTLTLSGGTFAGGSTTATANAVNGIATFSNLKIDAAGNYTLSATDGILASTGPSNTFNISPTTASKVAFSQQPSNAIAGSLVSPAVSVTVEDRFGNVVTGDNSSVTLGLSGGKFAGGSTTATANAMNGVATFPNLVIDAAGTYSLSATDGALTASGPSNNFNIIAATPSDVVFGQQPTDTTAGVAISPAVTIKVEDAFGNLVTGDTSTVTLTLSSQSFEGGLTTATAVAAGGVATFGELKIDIAGNYTLAVTDGILTASGPNNNFTISPTAASKVAFSQQPSNAIAGSPISPAVAVEVEDRFGNVVTGDSSSVTLRLNGGTFAGGSTTAKATAMNGVATFPNLVIDAAGTYSLAATDGGLTAFGPTNNFTITAATPSDVVFGQQPTDTMAGMAVSPAVTVKVEDAFGNLVTGDTSTVTLTLSSHSFDGGSSTAAIAADDGVATFTALKIDILGSYTLSASDRGLTGSGPSNSFTIRSVTASQLAIHTQPSPNSTAGQPFAVQPVIYVEDASGNLETDDNSTVVSVALSSGDGLPEGTTSVTVKDGVATFAGLRETTAGIIALEFAGDGLTAGPSNNIKVSPAAPFRLAISTQPSATATAGQTFGTQPVVEELDLYGNLETTDSSTAITAAVTFGNGPLLGTTTAALVGGVATFTNLADSTVGTIALGFSGGGHSVGPSNQIVISSTPAPTLSSEPVHKGKVLNNKGKRTGKTALEFSFKYSTTMNQTSASLRTNYQVETAIIKGSKKKKTTTYKKVTFTEAFNPQTNTVTLTVTGNQPFTSGGRIIVNTAPPNGVASASGVPLGSDDADLLISAKARSITVG